jgi:multiple sugar transport system substrate-binding protein
MSAGSPDHTAAWRFIEFAMGIEGQQILAESGRTVPSRIDVANSDAFLDPDQPPRSSHVYLDAEAYLRTTPRTASWPRVEREANALLEEVFYGRIDRKTGLQRIEAAVQPLFALHENGTTP